MPTHTHEGGTELFLNLRPEQAHVVANVGDGTVQFRLPGLERLVALTNADRRFIGESAFCCA